MLSHCQIRFLEQPGDFAVFVNIHLQGGWIAPKGRHGLDGAHLGGEEAGAAGQADIANR